ncbi:MAG: hypothetical protein ACYS0D_16010 [Planctomycetota bacterium]|jgi:hypothetical protein
MAKQSASSKSRVTKKPTTTKKSVPSRPRARLDWSWVEKHTVHLVGLFVIGVLVGGFVLSGLQKASAEQSIGSPTVWQYSCLTVTPTEVSWTTPGRDYVAATPDELYKQITRSNPSGTPGEVTPLRITNLIGYRGWELVSVNRSEERRGADDYWFRRTTR